MLKAFARVGAKLGHRPWSQIAWASAIATCLIGNWLAPVGIRLKWRALDAPALFISVLLLSLWVYAAASLISTRGPRLLARGLGTFMCMLAVPVGCAGFLFRVDALPVATTSIGSDKVVASWMAGGAVGPHFTEFRQERSVLPGLLLARTIGSSDYLGDVTMSFTPPHSLRAAVADDSAGSPHVIDMSVSPLLPQ